MTIEKSYLNEEEKKKNKLTEKELKAEEKKQLEFKKKKEKISVEIESEDKLFHLKELVEKGILTKETAEKIVDGEEIDEKEISEIFDKISEIEDIKDIDNYLPKDLRITQEDYLKAINDDIFRVKTITKLDSALIILSKQINSGQTGSINIFSGFLNLLDKNLVKIQEHTIDIKDNLKKIDEKKGIGKEKLSLWKRFLNFLKELLK